MMPYEVGKTFIIRVPLLSIETYKELCSEKDGLPVIKTKETLTGYTHKLFTLRRKKGTDQLVPISCAHAEAEEGHRRAFAASLSISIHDCFAYLLCLWYNKQKAGILRRKLYESAGIIISIAR